MESMMNPGIWIVAFFAIALLIDGACKLKLRKKWQKANNQVKLNDYEKTPEKKFSLEDQEFMDYN